MVGQLLAVEFSVPQADDLVGRHHNRFIGHPVDKLQFTLQKRCGKRPGILVGHNVEPGAEDPRIAGESFDDERTVLIVDDLEDSLSRQPHPPLLAGEDRRIGDRTPGIQPYGGPVAQLHLHTLPFGSRGLQTLAGDLCHLVLVKEKSAAQSEQDYGSGRGRPADDPAPVKPPGRRGTLRIFQSARPKIESKIRIVEAVQILPVLRGGVQPVQHGVQLLRSGLVADEFQ